MTSFDDIIAFEWDKGNEEKNWIHHGISTKEAEQPFYDEKRLILDDITHSGKEKRFILIGSNKGEKILFIVFTFRIKKIRIISARRADRKEVDFYEKALSITKI